MTHEEKFTNYLGALSGAEKAFMITVTVENHGSALRALSRNLPSGGQVKIDGSVMYVKAEAFEHPEASQLQV